MSNADLEQVIDRIQKLLALSKSDNVHEAGLAAARAQDLMFRYHLTHQEIGEQSTKRANDIDFQLFIYLESNQAKQDFWRKRLLKVVCDYNFAKVIRVEQFNRCAVSIIAREVDIEHIKFLYVYLSETLCRICPRLKPTLMPKAKWDRGFYLGAVKGIRDALEEQRLADLVVEGGTALVLRSEEAVSEKFNELYPDSRRGRNVNGNVDGAAYATGYQEGKNVNFNRAIENRPQKGLL